MDPSPKQYKRYKESLKTEVPSDPIQDSSYNSAIDRVEQHVRDQDVVLDDLMNSLWMQPGSSIGYMNLIVHAMNCSEKQYTISLALGYTDVYKLYKISWLTVRKWLKMIPFNQLLNPEVQQVLPKLYCMSVYLKRGSQTTGAFLKIRKARKNCAHNNNR